MVDTTIVSSDSNDNKILQSPTAARPHGRKRQRDEPATPLPGKKTQTKRVRFQDIPTAQPEYSNVNSNQGALGLTPLILAARAGDAKRTAQLIERGVDLGECDRNGFDALMYAVRDGHVCVASLILARLKREVEESGNTTYSFKNKYGLSHILYAALNGHTDCVILMRRYGSKVNVCDERGVTPLMAAAQNGHPGTVHALVKLGASINAQDRKGLTALARAVKAGSFACVRMLVRLGADVNLASKNNQSPLLWAVLGSQTEIGELLLTAGARVCNVVRVAVLKTHMKTIESPRNISCSA